MVAQGICYLVGTRIPDVWTEESESFVEDEGVARLVVGQTELPWHGGLVWLEPHMDTLKSVCCVRD